MEKLIKEAFKDIALRIYDLNYEDRKCLLAEYREWILKEINLDDILMLPYEAYTDILEKDINEDL